MFCWKNASSFCIAKATHIFSSKIINVFENVLAMTVIKFAINELIKLTMLWTTGPRFLSLSQEVFNLRQAHVNPNSLIAQEYVL